VPPHHALKRLALAGLCIGGLVAGKAHAVCVGATVVAGSTLQFLPYDPVSASPSLATGLVSVGCAGIGLLPSFTVSLNIGTGTSFATRQLANGAARLSYNLYRDFDRLQIWGDGTASTFQRSFNSILSLGTVEYTVYGRIPAGQDKPSGSYSSTITVTIDF
jgi:spore coat protein U-like protein